MQLTWKGIGGVTITAPVKEPELAYVECLGRDDAVEFLLRLGGGYLYIRQPGSNKPLSAAPAYSFLSAGQQRRLEERFSSGGAVRVPVSNRFLARALRERGLGVSEIARTLRVTDAAVRAQLRSDAELRANNLALKKAPLGIASR